MLVGEALGDCEVSGATFLNDFSRLQMVVSGQRANHSSMSLYLVQLNTNLLFYYREDISVHLSSKYQKIGFTISILDNLIVFLKNSFGLIHAQIKEIVKHFDNKMFLMECAIKDNRQEEMKEKTVNEEFFQFLNTGICSPALQQFLGKELYEIWGENIIFLFNIFCSLLT